MAWKPRDLFGIRSLRVLLLAGVLTGLCGCEVGRTMFQYSSGSSSPWVGIDLLPRKPKATKINHRKVVPSGMQESKEHLLSLRKEPMMEKFQKKPIRLNLPSSQSSDQNKHSAIKDLASGPLPTSSVIDF